MHSILKQFVRNSETVRNTVSFTGKDILKSINSRQYNTTRQFETNF